jgi:hypothetical protein
MKKRWDKCVPIQLKRKTEQVSILTDIQKVKIRAGKPIDRYTKSENQGR